MTDINFDAIEALATACESEENILSPLVHALVAHTRELEAENAHLKRVMHYVDHDEEPSAHGY